SQSPCSPLPSRLKVGTVFDRNWRRTLASCTSTPTGTTGRLSRQRSSLSPVAASTGGTRGKAWSQRGARSEDWRRSYLVGGNSASWVEDHDQRCYSQRG